MPTENTDKPPNRPSSPTERFLDPKRPIVTKTDLQGVITYANPAFVEISGFSRDELIGAHHNIVRHPDMPKAAFADLWRTVKAGHPWHGRVKNRTKCGGFYWVDAYITPVTEHGRVIGYMSVRTAPSSAAKHEAEALYRAVREGRATLPATPLGGGIGLGHSTAAALLLMLALTVAAAATDGALAAGLAVTQGVLAVALWFGLRQQLCGPLNAMLGCFQQIAEGRLDADTGSAGCRQVRTLQTALRSMQVRLRALIGDVVASAADTARAAGTLHDNVRELQRSAHQQAEQIASSAAAMEELAVSVGEIASATAGSAQQADAALGIVAEGQRNMSAAANSTQQVVQAVAANQDMLDALAESVNKIAEVSASISGIAKRTNLLALNAAIEAARAGEQGRGFAVVAGEVTELAGQTQRSTDSIARLIEEIAARKTQVTEAMACLRAGVGDSVERIHAVSGEFDQIAAAGSTVATNAEEVRHMLHQQEAASGEVANIMERMSSLTDASLNTVGTVEREAGALEATAHELQLLVKHFADRMHHAS